MDMIIMLSLMQKENKNFKTSNELFPCTTVMEINYFILYLKHNVYNYFQLPVYSGDNFTNYINLFQVIPGYSSFNFGCVSFIFT